MATTITNYKELRREKIRLETLRQQQLTQLKEDWHALKEDLKPTFLMGDNIKKALTRKASGAFTNLGINLVADGLIKKGLLANSGVISRWVIPFLIKNYASHLVDEPEKIVDRIKNLFKRKKNRSEEGTAPPAPVQAVRPEPVNRATAHEAGMEAV